MDVYPFNNATAGLSGKSCLSLGYRNQWDGLEGSPKEFQLNYSSPLKQINGAFGASVSQSNSGVHRMSTWSAGYNQVRSNNNYLLSGGIGIGFSCVEYDYNAIRTPNGEYNGNSVNHNDPSLLNLDKQQNLTILGSMYLQTKLLEGGIEFRRNLAYLKGGIHYFQPEQLFKVLLVKELSVDYWNFKAIIMDYTDFKENQEELILNGRFKNQYMGGLVWRGFRPSSLDAFGIHFAFNIKNGLWLGYSLEWPLNKLSPQINSITQQFGLKFEFSMGKSAINSPIIYNSRW